MRASKPFVFALVCLAALVVVGAALASYDVVRFGTGGGGDGQYVRPRAVSVSPGNDVYVADTDNNRVQKLTSEGVFVAKWGSTGSGDSQFDFPQGIANDSDGNVYVSDFRNSRIERFSPTGAFLGQWAVPSPGQIAYGGGSVYVLAGTSAVKKYTTTG